MSRAAHARLRTLADLDIACLVRVCVTDDVNAARQWLRRELTGYAIVEAYQRYFRQISFAHEAEAVLTKWQAGERWGAIQEVSDHMTDRLAVCGPAGQCQVRLQRVVDAGVNLPIVFPFSPEADFHTSMHRTLTALGPRQAGHRPTKAS